MFNFLNESLSGDQILEDPEIQEARFFASIGYLGFLCFVPLYLQKGNKFARFHGRQALVLFILESAVWILKAVPVAGPLFFYGGWILFGVLAALGFSKAAMGKSWPIPVIHEIAEKMTL